MLTYYNILRVCQFTIYFGACSKSFIPSEALMVYVVCLVIVVLQRLYGKGFQQLPKKVTELSNVTYFTSVKRGVV